MATLDDGKIFFFFEYCFQIFFFFFLLPDDGILNFKRDIVQFVPYRKFSGISIQKLAKETLAEVPRQVKNFFFQVEIKFFFFPVCAIHERA